MWQINGFLEQEVLLISLPKFHILFLSILLAAVIPYSAYRLSLLMVLKILILLENTSCWNLTVASERQGRDLFEFFRFVNQGQNPVVTCWEHVSLNWRAGLNPHLIRGQLMTSISAPSLAGQHFAVPSLTPPRLPRSSGLPRLLSIPGKLSELWQEGRWGDRSSGWKPRAGHPGFWLLSS